MHAQAILPGDLVQRIGNRAVDQAAGPAGAMDPAIMILGLDRDQRVGVGQSRPREHAVRPQSRRLGYRGNGRA